MANGTPVIELPFIGGAYEQRSPTINAQRSINCFPVIDNKDAKKVLAMYHTPGLKLFANVSGYGPASAVDMVISEDTTLTEDLRVSTLVINEEVTLDTAGYTISCTTSFTNNGTVTDTHSGGTGGVGGAGGTSTTIDGGDGGDATLGGEANKPLAGKGGDGGSGGGGGGGATTKSTTLATNGGAGGNGGRGGGRVIIFARTVTNNGTIDVSGEDGGDGGDGVDGAATPVTGTDYLVYNITGGSGGGAAGSGGDGGSVYIYYETLAAEGTITVTKGTAGTRGTDGEGYIFEGVAGSYGYATSTYFTCFIGQGGKGGQTGNAAHDGGNGNGSTYKGVSPYVEQLPFISFGGVGLLRLYPPTFTSDYILASSTRGDSWQPYMAVNPSLSLIGGSTNNEWNSASYTIAAVRFHIDLGEACSIRFIEYDNRHESGGFTNNACKNFTFWGSNSGSAFNTLTYSTDTGWTEITSLSSKTFAKHAEANRADTNFITVTSTTNYRYYAFKMTDHWERSSHLGLRNIALIGSVTAESTAVDGTDGTLTKTQLVYPELVDSDELRCFAAFNDNLYIVIGSYVFQIESDGTITNLGALETGTGEVFMAYNGVEILIVDGSSFGHYIAAGALEDVSILSDYPEATSCTFMDGYFIVTKKDTGQICISGLYDVNSWDALDYATAEGAPDEAIRVFSTNHNLWVFGSETTEIFYNSGNADFPFTRINGGLIEDGLGAIESVCLINSQFYWMNSRREIVRNVGYQREKISTIHIDTELQGYATVSDARGWEYRLDGHIFYVITFPTADKTWVFDVTTEFWHEWSSFKTAGVATYGRHRGNKSVYYNGKWLIGDYTGGKIYELDMSTYTDDGEVIPRTRRTQAVGGDANRIAHHRIELLFEVGLNVTSVPQASLRWSDDGTNTWSTAQVRSLGASGEYTKRVIWNRLGNARGRVYELTYTANAPFILKGCISNLEGMRS
jgi:hypothetical protein